MACTWGEEEHKPRNVLFLSFFTSHIVQVCFCCSHLFSCLSISYFPSLSSPFSLFFMSPISPRQYPFPSVLPFFLAEEAQCLCIKVTTGGGLQPAREENKVTADKWKKLINKNSCFGAADDCYTSCSFSFCLFCKIEVVTFYHFTCCLM